MGSSLVSLWVLVSLTFVLARLAPGGPFDTEKMLPYEVQKNINVRYGLDLPLTSQYFRFLGQTAHLDFGTSFQYLEKPVAEIIQESVPTSLTLGIASLLFAIPLGIWFGVIAGTTRYPWLARALELQSMAGVSLPSFLIGGYLVWVFSVKLNLFPPALAEEGLLSWVLPILTLAIRPMALIQRLTRATLTNILKTDFIRTAHAKGLALNVIYFRHALKNCAVPLLAVLGPLASQILVGSFVVETLFQLGGIGRQFVSSVLNRDYPVLIAVTLYFGIIIQICHFLADFFSGFFDPRFEVN